MFHPHELRQNGDHDHSACFLRIALLLPETETRSIAPSAWRRTDSRKLYHKHPETYQCSANLSYDCSCPNQSSALCGYNYASGCLPMAFSMEGLWRSRALIFPLHFAIITFKVGNPGISGRRFLYALRVLSGKGFEMMNRREWISLPVPAVEKPDAFL